MLAPKVTQSKVTPGPSIPLGALTTTSLALEYQEGQADARTKWFQMTSADALTTMSLWANRSALSGVESPGQWMCADPRWASSVIDMASLLVCIKLPVGMIHPR